jgi:hypothetical protein
MTPLVVGTLLALVALAFVLYPLFVEQGPGIASRGDALPLAEDPVAALREIEFDRATGKLSDADYGALKTRYTELALAAMRAGRSAAALAAMPAEDAAEAAVRRHRAALRECVECGPRPEPDAVYCSSCGRFLPGRCAGCGATADQPGQRFCAGCGSRLAA